MLPGILDIDKIVIETSETFAGVEYKECFENETAQIMLNIADDRVIFAYGTKV